MHNNNNNYNACVGCTFESLNGLMDEIDDGGRLFEDILEVGEMKPRRRDVPITDDTEMIETGFFSSCTKNGVNDPHNHDAEIVEEIGVEIEMLSIDRASSSDDKNDANDPDSDKETVQEIEVAMAMLSTWSTW